MQNTQVEKIFCRYDDGGIHYGSVSGNTIRQLDKAPWEGGVETGVSVNRDEVRLLYPSEPGTIVGLGKSYAESWADKTPPKSVRWFVKPLSAAASDGDTIVLPPSIDEVKVEAELVIVIGKKVVNADEKEAEKAIFGYTIGNDMMGTVDSYHRLQNEEPGREEPLLSTGLKVCDGFQPFGPFIHQGFDWRDRTISMEITFKNSSAPVYQEQNTNTFLYSPAKMVSDLSRVLTLSPGDIIATSTVQAHLVQPGALVKISIDGLGVLTNQIEK